METYGIKGTGEKFRGYCDLVEIYGQIVLIVKKTIYDVPTTRNLVAENNVTFHYHFYCHFGKHIMNSKQRVSLIYWASQRKEPSILQRGGNTEGTSVHISKICFAGAHNLIMIWDPNKVVSMIASKRKLPIFKMAKIPNDILLRGRASSGTMHTESYK